MKKSVIWVGAIIFALLVVGIPFILDWCIIGNEIPSNISNSDWVSFLGGYIGAILGAMFSLVGIAWTIKFTREQNRADRELQIRPYFDIRYQDVKEPCRTDSWLGYVDINIQESNDDSSENNQQKHIGSGLLCLKNVGNGPATNINFEISLEKTKIEYKAWYINKNSKVTTNSISPGDTSELSIDVSNSLQAPKLEDVKWIDDLFANYDKEKYKYPEPFTIKIKILYSDLMSNRFQQEILIDSSCYMVTSKTEDFKYHCDLNLVEIGTPKILKDKNKYFFKQQKH